MSLGHRSAASRTAVAIAPPRNAKSDGFGAGVSVSPFAASDFEGTSVMPEVDGGRIHTVEYGETLGAAPHNRCKNQDQDDDTRKDPRSPLKRKEFENMLRKISQLSIGLLLTAAVLATAMPVEAAARRATSDGTRAATDGNGATSIYYNQQEATADTVEVAPAESYVMDAAPEAGGCEPAPCCAPCVDYCDRTRCFRCSPKQETCLVVCNPCTGCTVNIPVCIPCCCEGCPEICGRRGLFGAGVVTYRWCCGFEAVIRFTRCGDIKVVYRD